MVNITAKSFEVANLQMQYKEAGPAQKAYNQVENKGNKVTDVRAQPDSKSAQISVVSNVLSIFTVYRCSHGYDLLKDNC